MIDLLESLLLLVTSVGCVVMGFQLRTVEALAIKQGDALWRAANELPNGPTRERVFAAVHAIEDVPHVRKRVDELSDGGP